MLIKFKFSNDGLFYLQQSCFVVEILRIIARLFVGPHFIFQILWDASIEQGLRLLALKVQLLDVRFLVFEIQIVEILAIVFESLHFLESLFIERLVFAFIDVISYFFEREQVLLAMSSALQLVSVSDSVVLHSLTNDFPSFAKYDEVSHELKVERRPPEVHPISRFVFILLFAIFLSRLLLTLFVFLGIRRTRLGISGLLVGLSSQSLHGTWSFLCWFKGLSFIFFKKSSFEILSFFGWLLQTWL